jgi:hypothetical protein
MGVWSGACGLLQGNEDLLTSLACCWSAARVSLAGGSKWGQVGGS